MGATVFHEKNNYEWDSEGLEYCNAGVRTRVLVQY